MFLNKPPVVAVLSEARGPSALARLEMTIPGRRPERSEGCLAIARQDSKKDARQDELGGLFKQPLSLFDFAYG